MHRISQKLAPLVRQAANQGLNNVAHEPGPSQLLQGGGALQALGNRPISTVVNDTQVSAGMAPRIGGVGHVQLQPSANDLKNYPGLAPALGHSPLPDRAKHEKVDVHGFLNDGRPFSVQGRRSDAQKAGDDKPLDPKKSTVIDHGDMTPAQAQAYLKAQDKPVFPKYETSGLEGANCVHGHAKLMQEVLGHDVGHVPAHTLPQEMGNMVKDVKTK